MKISFKDKVKYIIKGEMDIPIEDKVYVKKDSRVKINQYVRKTFFLSGKGNITVFKHIEVTRKDIKTRTKIIQNYRSLKDLEIDNIHTISVEYTKHVGNKLIKKVSKTLECERSLINCRAEYNYDKQGRLHGRKYDTNTFSKYSNGNYTHGVPHGLHVRSGVGGMSFLDLDYTIYNKGEVCEHIEIFQSLSGGWFDVFVDDININSKCLTKCLTSLEGKSEEFIRNFIHKVLSNIYKYSDEYSRVENINRFIRHLSWTILIKDVDTYVRTVIKNIIIENNKEVL